MNPHPPVLFLDVDGVLNSCMKSTYLDPEKCELLAGLCRRTGCKVVLSSTWRKYPALLEKKLFPMFASYGIDCIGQTPELVYERRLLDSSTLYTDKPRYQEIGAWLDAHPEVIQYAIVDDDRDADDHTGRYVRTESSEGLKEQHVAKLEELLQTP